MDQFSLIKWFIEQLMINIDREANHITNWKECEDRCGWTESLLFQPMCSAFGNNVSHCLRVNRRRRRFATNHSLLCTHVCKSTTRRWIPSEQFIHGLKSLNNKWPSGCFSWEEPLTHDYLQRHWLMSISTASLAQVFQITSGNHFSFGLRRFRVNCLLFY